MLRYGSQNYTSIGETVIQVRWYDNTTYIDSKQNIMPSLSLLWIFACDKTIRDTQKWSFKERKNAPNKSTNASKKHLEKMIGRAANQYSCLTYTAWVETLYTGIGRTAILFIPCVPTNINIMNFNIYFSQFWRILIFIAWYILFHILYWQTTLYTLTLNLIKKLWHCTWKLLITFQLTEEKNNVENFKRNFQCRVTWLMQKKFNKFQ